LLARTLANFWRTHRGTRTNLNEREWRTYHCKLPREFEMGIALDVEMTVAR